MPSEDEVIQDFFSELQRDPRKKAMMANAINSQSYDNIARAISNILRSIGYVIRNVFGLVGGVMDWFSDLFS